MTLNITLVAPWGIWQCTDHRLTDPNTGALVDDYSAKHIAIITHDGGALLAYSGIGSVGNVHISDWVREIIRGENRSLDETQIDLKEQATRDIGPIIEGKWRHLFSIGAFLQGQAWILEIRNFKAAAPGEFGPPRRKFESSAHRIKEDPFLSLWGTGRDCLSVNDISELTRISKRKPRKPDDFHGLLKKFNQKASNHTKCEKLVSKKCITTYMSPDAKINTKTHPEKEGVGNLITTPIILNGIDLTDLETLSTEHLFILAEGRVDKDEYYRNQIDKALKESVKTKNRLRR